MATAYTNGWISYLKLLLISAGSVSLAMAMREVVSWMKPPYLYIVVNAIIITIAVSSRFQSENSISVESHSDFEEIDPVSSTAAAYGSSSEYRTLEFYKLNGDKLIREERVETDNLLTYNPPPEEIVNSPENAPPISHRKPTRSTPGQGIMAQRVAKSDTLEDTWKRIMEEKSRATQQVGKTGPPWPLPNLIRDHLPDSPPRLESSTTRKQPLSSQDELNRRVEDFIRKVNHELRLQRVHGRIQ